MILHPIEQSLVRLGSLHADYRDRMLTHTDSRPEWISAADLVAKNSVHLKVALNQVMERYKADGLRPPAALWFGHYAYAIEVIAIAFFMVERRVPDLSPALIHILLDDDGNVGNIAWKGRSFAALTDDSDAAHPDCIVFPSLNPLRDHLRKQLVASLNPVVEGVSAYSSFGKPGLWALAADYTAYAFAWLGKSMGDETIGVEESRLFSATTSQVSAKRDFIPIHHVGFTHHLLERTSCCLYYKVEGGGYCHSCPRRPLEERIHLIKKQMEVEAAETQG